MTEQAAVTGPVTTRFKPPAGKPFAWSYSKMKNYELCPKRHYEIDVSKKVRDTGGENLIWGNQVHDAMRDRLRDKKPLTPEMIDYEMFAKRIEEKQALLKAEMVVEREWAINADFQPVGWFTRAAWFRGKVDLVLLAPPVALVVDWKTGRIQEDSVQLALMAQLAFSHYPELHTIATRYVWLKEHAETDERFTRQDLVRLWPSLLARVKRMEDAAVNMDYPPTPGGLCKAYCPVVSCPFHGKGKPHG